MGLSDFEEPRGRAVGHGCPEGGEDGAFLLVKGSEIVWFRSPG